MRRIDRLRRNHRKDVVDEELPKPPRRLTIDITGVRNSDAFGGKFLAQLTEHPLLQALKPTHLAMDFRELLRTKGVTVERSWFFTGEREIGGSGANWRAEHAVFQLSR